MPKPGGTAARGYDTKTHQRRRRQDAKVVEAGGGVCWRCGRPIVPAKILRPDGRWTSNWHLGHDDSDRRVYRGPEHEACNLRAAGQKAARIRARRAVRRLVYVNASRQW